MSLKTATRGLFGSSGPVISRSELETGAAHEWRRLSGALNHGTNDAIQLIGSDASRSGACYDYQMSILNLKAFGGLLFVLLVMAALPRCCSFHPGRWIMAGVDVFGRIFRVVSCDHPPSHE
jgi:hypothetical protein